MNRRRLSQEEKQFIHNNYLKMTNLELAELLNRSMVTIQDYRSRMGLTKKRANTVVF